jgi:outer membrane protein OmpA-like peptidoglycan-associated protein
VDAAPGNPVTIQKRQPPAAQKTAALKPAPAKPAPAKPKQVATAPASDSGLGVVSGENAPAAQKPARVASLESGDVDSKNLSKQMSIQFPAGAEEPAPSVLDTVRALAGDLNTALANGSSRIQLEAFGGKQGDKGSDARRLSLKRALIIRQLLIDDGIPSERIDVRAMGGASEGSPDRVDVFVRA